MSRNAGVGATASVRRNGSARQSHLRQFSKSSLDPSSLELPLSPVTVSSASTPRTESKRGPVERRCTVTVWEGYSPDEVLLNLDLFPEFRPGSLVAATVIRADGDKAAATHGLHKLDGGVSKEGESPARKYIFIVKDVSKEFKSKHPGVEFSVLKHIAEAFGMRKGSTVLLTPVRFHAVASSGYTLTGTAGRRK